MPIAFVSRQFLDAFGHEVETVAKRNGSTVEFIIPPDAPGSRLSPADGDRIDCTFCDRDMRFDEQTNAVFEDAMMKSKSMKWLHVASSGLYPVAWVDVLAAKGATITSSTGSNAEPVAQTGFTGLLMLARGFPGYMRAQQQHEWQPLRGAALPNDLRGQTVLQLGIGAVGRIFAGYAKAFGLKVIGVRRTPMQPGEPVDEMHHPSRLRELLPLADWVVVTCPLTKETRNLLDADAFRLMRKGVRILSIARGEIVDTEALIQALRSGHVAGAHLDAHSEEPLPPESPLWDMPNVIVTPHNAAASTGNEKRSAEMFIANFGHWLRGEPLFNVQKVG